MQSNKSAVSNVSTFYGAGRYWPQIKFLASAKDVVEFQESDDFEIVLLHSESANQGIESVEEGSDNILNEECLSDEISGEVEIRKEIFADEITKKNPGTMYGVKVMKKVEAFVMQRNCRNQLKL